MTQKITASERRGILIIAALSLLITAAGLLIAHCNRPRATIQSPDIQILLDPQSPLPDTTAKQPKKPGKSRSTKPPKTYPRRNPLSEPV